MIEREGNIFDTEANYIGHGVNCRGVMGAGIAKQFKDRFQNNFILYRYACNYGLIGGDVVPFADTLDGRQVCVVNFASQYEPGPNATYDYLFNSLNRFVEQAKSAKRLERWGRIVAIPEIGCGIGGLEWSKVSKIIEAVEVIHDNVIEFEVWHYKE